MVRLSFKCTLLYHPLHATASRQRSQILQNWNFDIPKYRKLPNAKAMWLSFAGSLDTEESERIIGDLALM